MNSELVQGIKDMAMSQVDRVHTAFPGIIEVYNPDTGLATVKPIMRYKTKGGNYEDYPRITGVPVVFQQYSDQTATIGFPVKPQDGCLIVVSEESLDHWMYGQETGTHLKFDLTNAICIPGLFVPANKVVKEAIEQDAIIADIEGTRVTIKRKSEIILQAKHVHITGDLTVDGVAVAAAHV